MQSIYTLEHYRPAFPLTGDHVVIHRGTFEDNRDNLSPSMVYARDFYATNDAEALSKGEQASALMSATFYGFNEDAE